MRRSLIATACLALVLEAHAVGRPRVAVLDIVAEGMQPEAREQLETKLEESLHRAGYDVVDNKAVRDLVHERELPEGCTFGPCVEPIARALRVERFLNARVGADGQSYTFVLSMLEARQGAPIAQVVEACPVCTSAEVLDKLSSSIDALAGQRAGGPADVGPGAAPRRRSRVKGAWLLAGGVAAALGGAALVAWTAHDDPGWVTIGSGGTVALTGLVLLLGD